MSYWNRLREMRGAEKGSTIVMFAVALPALIFLVMFVVEVGNWFVHKRHLQLQADAGALAAGDEFFAPCSDTSIVGMARTFGGDPTAPTTPFNTQIPGANGIHLLFNSGAGLADQDSYYWPAGNEFQEGQPCAALAADVRLTEDKLPLFFGLASFLNVDVKARARVEAFQDTTRSGNLPIGVPDPDPIAAEVFFIDETTGQAIPTTPAATTLTKRAASGVPLLNIWDNVGAAASINVAGHTKIGVRISLSGRQDAQTRCGLPLVECYDMGSNQTFDALDPGASFIRSWSNAGTGSKTAPILRDVILFTGFSGACTDPTPYFIADGNCHIGVKARIDFGAFNGSQGAATVTVLPDNNGCPNSGQNPKGCPMTYSDPSTGGDGYWSTTQPLLPAAGFGPLELNIGWRTPNAPLDPGGNGNFPTPAHRTFIAAKDRSGPIRKLIVTEDDCNTGASLGVQQTFQNDTPPGTTTHCLVVQIGLKGNLELAQANEPPIELRVTGSQNQAVDCSPSNWPGYPNGTFSNLRNELGLGCPPEYTKNLGSPCPAYNTLWSLPEPWDCVKLQTGGAVGQVGQGMRDRVHKGLNGCVSPNYWNRANDALGQTNVLEGDLRILPLFVTPFGTFSGTGNDIVPVQRFADFYVTGWGGSGNNDDSCTGDEVPGKSFPSDTTQTGFIIGHFMKYFDKVNRGGGSGPCDLNSVEPCVTVLVR